MPDWKFPVVVVSLLILIAVGVIDLSSRLQLFVLIYVSISIAFIGLYKRGGPLDIFSPATGLTVLLFLYSVSSAMYAESTGVTAQGDAVSSDELVWYYVCCITGLFGLATGILYSRFRQNELRHKTRPLPGQFDNDLCFRKTVFLSILLGGMLFSYIAPHFDVFNVPSYAERALDLRVERKEDVASGLKEVFMVILPVTIILSAATLAMFRKQWRYYSLGRFAGFGLIVLYIVRNALAGWRSLVISALLIPVVYYHYRVRPIRVWMAVVFGISIYLLMNVLSLVRISSDPAVMMSIMLDEVSENRLHFLKLTSSTELLVGTNLMRLISGIWSNETTYTYGVSILNGILIYLPRALFPGRPLPISEQFVDVFYPGVLESGGGYGFFILQEGYWAFGIVGIFIFMFLYSAIVERIYCWFRDRMKYDLVALGYSGVYSVLVLYSVRSGIMGNFKLALMGLIPYLLIAYFPMPAIFSRNT